MPKEMILGFTDESADIDDYIGELPQKGRLEIYSSKSISLAASKKFEIDQGDINIAFSGYLFSNERPEEQITRLYRKKGIEFPKELNGNFAVAIYDEKKDKLLLARDKVGQKPIYFSKVEGGVVFSTVLTALFRHPKVKNLLNKKRMGEYLSSLQIQGKFGETLVKGVRRLPPASILQIGKKSEITQYWDVYHQDKRSISDKEAVKRTYKLLKEATKKTVDKSSRPLNIFFSGGFDSLLLTSLLKDKTEDIQTYTWGWTDKYLNSVEEKAKKLDLSHNRLKMDFGLPGKREMWDLEMPDPVHALYFNLPKKTKKLNIKEYFTGDSASVPFPAKLDNFFKLDKLKKAGSFLKWARYFPYHRFLNNRRETALNILTEDSKKCLISNFRTIPYRTIKYNLKGSPELNYPENVSRKLKLENRTLPENFNYLKFWGMASRSKARMPSTKYNIFLYPPLVKFSFSLPIDQRRKRRIARSIIRRKVPQEIIDWEPSGKEFISKIISKKFESDYEKYQRKVHRFLNRGFLKPRVKKILFPKEFEQLDSSEIVFNASVYALEVWIETIIEQEKPWAPQFINKKT